MERKIIEITDCIGNEINRISSAKLSTRVELYRRLSIAKDFLDTHRDKRIKVSEAADVAALSIHHFKRAFKELFNITPHQYHIKKRLDNSVASQRRTFCSALLHYDCRYTESSIELVNIPIIPMNVEFLGQNGEDRAQAAIFASCSIRL